MLSKENLSIQNLKNTELQKPLLSLPKRNSGFHVFAAFSIAMFFYFAALTNAKAQLPLSEIERIITPQVEATALSKNRLNQEYKLRTGELFSIKQTATPIEIGISPEWEGTWEILPGGEHLWRVIIASPGALHMAMSFDHFVLPKGAEMNILTKYGNHIYGPFKKEDIAISSTMWTPRVEEDELIIEVRLPQGTKNQFNLEVSRIHYGVDFQILAANTTCHSSSPFWDPGGNDNVCLGPLVCAADVACMNEDIWSDTNDDLLPIPEVLGDNVDWNKVKRSVVQMDLYGGLCNCTGTLVNNTNNDAKPLLLTASHCIQACLEKAKENFIEGIETPQDMADTIQLYWNFQNSSCREHNMENTDQNNDGRDDRRRGDGNTQLVTGPGAKILMHFEKYALHDVSLLDLSDSHNIENLPCYDPYFAGWDRTVYEVEEGLTPLVGIHHPAGGVKSVSIQPVLKFYGDKKKFQDIPWRYGASEGGSSGSALFGPHGHILGAAASIGSSVCTDAGSTYSSFNYFWWIDEDDINKGLKPFLAPGLSDDEMPLILEGLDPYKGGDCDNDTVEDLDDNCPTVSNENQDDADSDGIGDECDHGGDSDFDGVIDAIDNCPDVPNPLQHDCDNQNGGDACDINGNKNCKHETYLLMDASGSMLTDDESTFLSREEHARAGALSYLTVLKPADPPDDANVDVGLIQFGEDDECFGPKDPDRCDLYPVSYENEGGDNYWGSLRRRVKDDYEVIGENQRTALLDAVKEAAGKFDFDDEANVQSRNIYLLTDGKENASDGFDFDDEEWSKDDDDLIEEFVEDNIDKNIKVSSLAVSNEVHTELLESLAKHTGGHVVFAQNVNQVPNAYTEMTTEATGYSLLIPRQEMWAEHGEIIIDKGNELDTEDVPSDPRAAPVYFEISSETKSVSILLSNRGKVDDGNGDTADDNPWNLYVYLKKINGEDDALTVDPLDEEDTPILSSETDDPDNMDERITVYKKLWALVQIPQSDIEPGMWKLSISTSSSWTQKTTLTVSEKNPSGRLSLSVSPRSVTDDSNGTPGEVLVLPFGKYKHFPLDMNLADCSNEQGSDKLVTKVISPTGEEQPIVFTNTQEGIEKGYPPRAKIAPFGPRGYYRVEVQCRIPSTIEARPGYTLPGPVASFTHTATATFFADTAALPPCDFDPSGDCDNDGLDNGDESDLPIDTDHDGWPDILDPDCDNDEIPDGVDNCVLIPNSDQLNTGGDPELGDACDCMSPPTILIPRTPLEYSPCTPGPDTVVLAEPQISDDCTDYADLDIRVFLNTVNGLDAGNFEISNLEVELPVGEYTVTWVVTDSDGQVSEADQTFTVNFYSGTECCAGFQTILEGTEGNDMIFENTGDPLCIFAGGGEDHVTLVGFAEDYIVAGDGGDTISARAGEDTLIGGSGGDSLYMASGSRAFGMAGEDHISCVHCTSPVFANGGSGDDHIVGGAGNDLLIPGPGVDDLYAGGGNDTVYIYHPCELSPYKSLDGEDGFDVLYLPVSVAEAQSMGVIINGFEEVRFTPTHMIGFSECLGL